MLNLHFLQIFYEINPSKEKAESTFFYSNKCKHEELTQNPETKKFEKHLMI